jgi:hypothetical protein
MDACCLLLCVSPTTLCYLFGSNLPINFSFLFPLVLFSEYGDIVWLMHFLSFNSLARLDPNLLGHDNTAYVLCHETRRKRFPKASRKGNVQGEMLLHVARHDVCGLASCTPPALL